MCQRFADIAELMLTYVPHSGAQKAHTDAKKLLINASGPANKNQLLTAPGEFAIAQW